jgi:hypothetical protein
MRPRADLDLSSDDGAYEGFKAVVDSSRESVLCSYIPLAYDIHQLTSQTTAVFGPTRGAIMFYAPTTIY